jgi:DNA repair protein RecO (recombination protein O)
LAALQCLKEAPDDYRTLLTIFQLKLMAALGYRPHTGRCPVCAGPLAGEDENVLFSFKFGGIICDDCRIKDQDAVALSPDTRRHMEAALETPLAHWRDLDFSADNVRGVALLTEFVAYHLDRKLKSPHLLDI